MKKYRIGLIGCGAIGTVLAREVDKRKDYKLAIIFDVEMKKAKELYKQLAKKPKIANTIDKFLTEEKDLAVEAAAYQAVNEYGEKILESSDLMIMSTAAFVIYKKLYSQLKKKALSLGRKIYLPSGAIVGIDGVKSVKEMIEEVTLKTIKNPKSIEQTDYLNNKGIYLKGLKKKTIIFKGTAKKAAYHFPKNLNIAATLSFCGVGYEKTNVIFIADPNVKENIHEIFVRGLFGEFRTQTKNMPSPDNLKTSYLACLSAIAMLFDIKNPFQIGT